MNTKKAEWKNNGRIEKLKLINLSQKSKVTSTSERLHMIDVSQEIHYYDNSDLSNDTINE